MRINADYQMCIYYVNKAVGRVRPLVAGVTRVRPSGRRRRSIGSAHDKKKKKYYICIYMYVNVCMYKKE